MFDLSIATRERHERFIRRAVEAGEVWVLAHQDDEGSWATSHVEVNGADGGAVDVPVVPVWSDRADALQCARDPWDVYTPQRIALDDFIELALHDMHEKQILVGTNWNAQLIGRDIEAIELARELTEALQARGGQPG